MKFKKYLSFKSLRKKMSSIFHNLSDSRQFKKLNYSIHDAMISAFACMYFQDPSLLQFQKRLRDSNNTDNLQTLFDVKNIPKTTQMKEIIDDVPSEELTPIFKNYFSRIQRGNHLSQYQLLPNLYICSIDGTQFFSSETVHCSNCLKTEHKNGSITYSHKVLQAAIMNPNMHQVIPLMPEEICNSDGDTKQDCEINAAKRLIPKIRKNHPQLGIIITADDLFSKQPFILEVLEKRMHYMLVAKPSDHIIMMKHIEKSTLDELIINTKDRVHIYQWINNIPLNGRKDAINVNYFHYKIISINDDGTEKVCYKNSWVTDLEITKENVSTLVKGARCHWKIENECFNTLKNQGYYIEHNYGHGNKNLCFNFFLLTLLAFFFHQIFELTDRMYQAAREKFGSKRHMWETLRAYVKILIFETWQHLLDFSLTPKKYNPSCHFP